MKTVILNLNFKQENSSGYTAIITNEHLTGTPIIIDTISPTLVLNGVNNTAFAVGGTYTDPGATAYDLSYGFKSISFSVGSPHNALGSFFLRYTAPPDIAGNPGLTITRNVQVINSSFPDMMPNMLVISILLFQV